MEGESNGSHGWESISYGSEPCQNHGTEWTYLHTSSETSSACSSTLQNTTRMIWHVLFDPSNTVGGGNSQDLLLQHIRANDSAETTKEETVLTGNSSFKTTFGCVFDNGDVML